MTIARMSSRSAVRGLCLAAIACLALAATSSAGRLSAVTHRPAHGAARSPVTLHGGFVQRRPRIYLVDWGPRWFSDHTAKRVMTADRTMFTHLRRSHVQRILMQYYDRRGSVTDDVRLAGSWVDPSVPRVDVFSGVERNPRRVVGEAAHAAAVNHWSVTRETQIFVFPEAGAPGAAFALSDRSDFGCADHESARHTGLRSPPRRLVRQE